MLKKEILEKLKTDFKLDTDKLVAAITAPDEVDYVLPADVTMLSTTDLATRDENMKKAGKAEGETSGETKGKEIAVKKIAKALALDEVKVGTDIAKLESEATAKFKAGDEGLNQQVKQLLIDKEVLTKKAEEAEGKASAAGFDSELISQFPVGRDQTLKDSERLLLIKSDITFEMSDGKRVAKRNGAIVTDPTTHAPLPVNKVIETYFTERKWNAAAGGDGGRGGGDNGAGGTGMAGIKKLTAFTEKWKVENPGKNDNSPEFDAALSAHTKDNKDFDFNT